MSLKEDDETYERHLRAGTLAEHFAGTAKPIELQDQPWPADPSAGAIRGKELGTNNKEDG